MPKVSPDVILLDVRVPEMDGLVALAKLKELLPQASVLMVTLYDGTDCLLKAVSSGAAGYVLKDPSREELIRAIRITAGGGAVIAPPMLAKLLQKLAESSLPESLVCPPSLADLSARAGGASFDCPGVYKPRDCSAINH